ncbi:MAG TPA: MFS transporter [Alphaproteobacteria bacterium]|nr:MFS transporter [Alphaproteobacteria bacterium]
MKPPALDRRAIAAWCLYDWANSAFPAVITTFVFATYFTQAVAPDPVRGTALWGHALAVAGLAIAVLSPVLGSIADYTGRQKFWLAVFSLFTATIIASLWFVRPSPDSIPLALVGIALATIGFEIGTVFYNALLPSVAPPDHVGRVSGWAWGLGYVGGIVCLGVILVLFVQAERPLLGLDKSGAEHVRIAGPFSALWFLVFIIPLFLFVPEPNTKRRPIMQAARQGLADLFETVTTLRQHMPVAWFMLANMVYTDGLTTLFAFGGVYAAGTFGMPIEEVIVFGIALNITAGIGAFGFAWIDDWIGARRTVAIGLAALIATGAGLLIVQDKVWFWGLGLLLGSFFGPVQAASRSLVARMAPPEHRAKMFGLFALSGRVTAFVGPAVLAWTTHVAQSQRAGMATILVFLLVGLMLLLKVREPVRN